MEHTLSPADLSILMHYYWSPIDHESVAEGRVGDVTDQFIEDGIFELNSREKNSFHRTYNLTEKGEAWVRAILSTPIPIMKWIDPRFVAVSDS